MKRSRKSTAIWISSIALVALVGIIAPILAIGDSEQPTLTATLYSDVIRFEAEGVASLQVTIYDLSENELWTSGRFMGDFVDWDRTNARGERLANGYYMYLAQGWDSSYTLALSRAGKLVLLPGEQAQLRSASPITQENPIVDVRPSGNEAPIQVRPMAVDVDHSGESWAFGRVAVGVDDVGAIGLRVRRDTSETDAIQIGTSSTVYFGDSSVGTMSNNVYSLYFNAETNSDYSGEINAAMIGVKGVMNHYGSGRLSMANGIMCQVNNRGAGTINRARGLVLQDPINSGGGTINENYGLVIGDMTAGTSANYAIYSYGGASYFADEVGIGTDNATDKLTIQASSGNVIACYADDSRTGGAALFRVESDGDVYADGTVHSASMAVGSADIAERINVSEWVEAGDIVEIDPEHLGFFRRASAPYSLRVAGIISASPGLTMGNATDTSSNAWNDNRPVLAITGRVPVKASTENGPIEVGDLLVCSSAPGIAMKGNPEDSIGAVVAKAMEPLEVGEGLVMAQVMLR